MSGTLIANLAPHGLAFPSCHEPAVRLSGFLLNGGLGNNYRAWGPSCASVEAIEVVDARGESIRADRNHNAELFWAARGAGPGFFGVVTRFHLKVFPLPRAILESTLNYRIEDLDKVAAWLPQLARSVPANVDWLLYGSTRRLRILATAFADTVSDGRKALEAFEAEPAGLSALSKNLYRETSVESNFGRADAPDPEGPRYLGEELWSNTSPQELLFSLRDGILAAPSGSSAVMLWCSNREGWPQQPDMAFSRSGSTLVGVYGIWRDAAQDAANQAWVRTTFASVDPLKVGYYVGETDLTVAPDRAKQCFSPSAWDKLIRLKRKYDPDDMFFSYLQHA
jgi:FAD/FMN-containing dehydrogenase